VDTILYRETSARDISQAIAARTGVSAVTGTIQINPARAELPGADVFPTGRWSPRWLRGIPFC
jgi:hypothetical protein